MMNDLLDDGVSPGEGGREEGGREEGGREGGEREEGGREERGRREGRSAMIHKREQH